MTVPEPVSVAQRAPVGEQGLRLVFLEMKESVYGGQEALLARCQYLDDVPSADYVVVHPRTDSAFEREYTRRRLQGRLLQPPNWVGRFAILRALYAAISVLRMARDQSIVHVEGYDALYVVGVLRRLGLLSRSSKLVATVRSERFLRPGRFDALFLSTSDQIATNSAYSSRHLARLLNVDPGDIAVTHSPINFDELDFCDAAHLVPSTKREVFRLGFIGSIEPRKRLDLFTRCVEEANQQIEGALIEGHVFGSTKHPGHLQLLTNLPPSLTSHGRQPIRRVLAELDGVLCPFEDEPLGRVVAEGLYAGLWVWARADGGMPEAGIGMAREIDAVDDGTFVDKFIADLRGCLDETPFATNADATAARDRLRETFGVTSIVASEMMLYQKVQERAAET